MRRISRGNEDARWCAEVGAVRVAIAETLDGTVVGAVSYARRPRKNKHLKIN